MANDLTMLQIVQTACAELGLNQPAAVVGSTDLQIQQLLALLNRDGIDLYQGREWTTLSGEHIVNLEEPINVTGDVTEGSQIITNVSSTAGLTAGAFSLSGEGVPTAQRLQTIDDATTVTCEMQNTVTGVGVPLIFSRDTYTIPSDFDHYISHTWWDRTNHWMLVGPQSPQFDQWQRSGIVTTGPRRRWRQIGHRPTVFRLWPPPQSSDVPAALVFEYISDGWVVGVDGLYKKRFTADTDTSLMDDQALILGCKWRFWQIKGFTQEAMQFQSEYVDYVNRIKARDGGMPDLAMNRRQFGYLLNGGQVQDGNWPGNS